MKIQGLLAVLSVFSCLGQQTFAMPSKQQAGKDRQGHFAAKHKPLRPVAGRYHHPDKTQGGAPTSWLVQASPAVEETRAASEEVFSLWGYGLGPAAARNLSTGSLLYAFSATSYREVAPYAEVRYRMGFGAADDGSAQILSMTLGGAYFLLSSVVTPMVGAEFGLGYARSTRLASTGGFVGALSTGLRLFRSAATQIEINGRYETIFNGNEMGMPATYGLQISILL